MIRESFPKFTSSPVINYQQAAHDEFQEVLESVSKTFFGNRIHQNLSGKVVSRECREGFIIISKNVYNFAQNIQILKQIYKGYKNDIVGMICHFILSTYTYIYIRVYNPKMFFFSFRS